MIAAALAIAVVALLDDRYDWPLPIKLAAQVGAALTAIVAGLFMSDIRLPVLGVVELGALGIVVTLVWVVFTTNAMNFIDGLNGLASGVTLIACLFIVMLFAFIVLRGFTRMLSEGNLFILLAVTGLLVQFGLQAIIHMSSTLHLMPTKGMTLPLISYGGSSLLGIAFGMGMVLALTRSRAGLGEV